MLTHGSTSAFVRSAVWAAWLGRDADAQVLADAAVRVSTDAFSKVVSEEARRWFVRGALRLEAGAPWEEAAALWRPVVAWAPAPPSGPPFADLVEQLTAQAAETPPRDVADPGALPPVERAAYFVARLSQTRGELWITPGDTVLVGCGEGTRWSDAVVALGRDAVPPLLAALDDRRVTRSAHRADLGLIWDDMVRVQDVAVACLQAIAKAPMPGLAHRSLGKLPTADRLAASERIRAWWREHGDQSELEMRVATLVEGDVGALCEIERLDPEAVDTTATLRRWAEKAETARLVPIAAELARRGDLSQKPRVRALVEDRRQDAVWDAIWYLLQWGDASDVALLAQRQREDRRRGTRLGVGGAYFPSVGAAAADLRRPDLVRPLLVPLLIEVLDERETSGSRRLPGGKSVAYSVADEAIDALVAITGHDARHDFADPPEKRFAAIDRWRAWWDAEGAAAFANAHPELRELALPSAPTDDALARALDVRFVSVASPSMARASFELPPATVRMLLARGEVAARTSAGGGVEFAVVSADAEAALFGTQSAPQAGDVPSLVVDASEAWIDTRGRLWCVARHGDSRLLRFDGRWTSVPRAADDPSWEHDAPETAWPGADGAMVLVDGSGATHLFDDAGHVAAASVEDLIAAHFDRVAAALAGAGPAEPAYGLRLAVDTAGRIWWWTSRDGIGVVADGRKFRGARPEIPPGGGERPSLEGLAPLDDGTVVAWSHRDEGVILRLGAERIEPGATVRVADGVPGVPSFAEGPAGTRLVVGLPLDPAAPVSPADGIRSPRLVASAAGTSWFAAGGGYEGGQIRAVAADRTLAWRIPRDRRFLGLVPADDGSAWVLLRGVLVHLRRAGDALEKDRRIELGEREEEGTLHSAGPGRLWLVSGGESERTVRCFLVGR